MNDHSTLIQQNIISKLSSDRNYTAYTDTFRMVNPIRHAYVYIVVCFYVALLSILNGFMLIVYSWFSESFQSHFAYSWWRHQIETFSALLALRAGNSPVTGEFPTQKPVTPVAGCVDANGLAIEGSWRGCHTNNAESCIFLHPLHIRVVHGIGLDWEVTDLIVSLAVIWGIYH